MATKESLVNNTYNKALKEFRFTLSEGSKGTLVLHHAPDGFIDKGATIYARHKKYGTVLRKTSKNELLFVKEGRDYIQNIYETTGIDANINLLVERFNNSTQTYETYPFANKVDLSTYKINEIGVSVQMMDTNFLEKVVNRSNINVDIKKLTSIEGTTIAPFTIDTIIMPDTSIDRTAIFEENSAGFISDLDHIVPIVRTFTEFAETQDPATGSGDVGKKTGSFFKETTETRILTLDFDIQGEFIGTGGSNPVEIDVNLVVIDGSEVEVSRTGIGLATGVEGMSFSFQKEVEITLNNGYSMNLEGTTNTVLERLRYDVADIDINEYYKGSPETEVNGMPYYEMFLRILQIITDTVNPLYSTKFGRTDSPITHYGSDGEIGFITRGLFFRNQNDLNNTIPLSLDTAFDSLSSIFRLGLGYKKVGTEDKIIIEELDYFYDANVILDLSDRVRIEDVEKSVMPDKHYKSGIFGFDKFTYEEESGLLEFNTKSNWTTEIQSVFNEKENISKLRADGQGMRLIMNAPNEADYNNTEDVKGDDDLFIIDAVRDGSDFVARTNEGLYYIGGSVYADSSFNLKYTPARNLRTWGQDFKAGLIKSTWTYLRWQTSDKNTTLVSRFTTEAANIYENGNVKVIDLNDSRYLPEEYKLSAPITTAELAVIDANPNGLIKLSDTKYGWINLFKPNTKDQMADFELLRCNLDVVTPV